MLAADAEGHEITTVEGLGTPEKLSPLQAAFVECDALQCGFCTPGFVVVGHRAAPAEPEPDASNRSRTAWPATCAAAAPTAACSRPCRRPRRPRAEPWLSHAPPKARRPHDQAHGQGRLRGAAASRSRSSSPRATSSPGTSTRSCASSRDGTRGSTGPPRSPARPSTPSTSTCPACSGAAWSRATVPAGEIVKIDTSQGRGAAGREGRLDDRVTHVRFAGQDVAAVAATSPELAEDAARLIRVTYDERPYVDRPPEGDGGRRAARLRAGRDARPAGRGRARATARGNVVGPGGAARAARRRREGPGRGRGRASRPPTTSRSTPTRRSRRTA